MTSRPLKLLQKIEAANTMQELDTLRDEVIHDQTKESLVAWQRSVRALGYGC